MYVGDIIDNGHCLPILPKILLKKNETMKTEQSLNAYRTIADDLVKRLKEEYDIRTADWVDVEETATERFEKLKKSFSNNLNHLDRTMHEWVNALPSHVEKVKGLMDVLRVQLHLGVAEGVEELERQKKAITRTWKEMVLHLRDMPGFQSMDERLQADILNWKVQLDLLRVQIALGRMEANRLGAHMSDEIREDVKAIGKAVESGAGIALEKVDELEVALSQLLEKLKKAKLH